LRKNKNTTAFFLFEVHEKMSFRGNLLQKIKLEGLASQVIGASATEQARHPINKEAMRSLLEFSPYQYQRERDLDIYVKPVDGELKMILVLDNELPIFRSTIKDVVTRRSPRTLEMWNFRTIRKILSDSDIKTSTRDKSVETILREAVAQLDLSYTEKDIEDLAREGMAWLGGSDAGGVEKSLVMFAALLGYRKPPKYFGLDHTICYGGSTTGPDNEVAFGPLVLYRPADNSLAWINKSLSRADKQQMVFIRAVAAGQMPVPVTGDAVFRQLQINVLEHPGPLFRD
jgi:hypothetical protein